DRELRSHVTVTRDTSTRSRSNWNDPGRGRPSVPGAAVQKSPRHALNSGPRIEIDRVKRRLPADIKSIAALSAETDIGDQFPDRDRTQMRPVRRVAEDVAARRCPDVAVDVTAKPVEQSIRAGGEQRGFAACLPA